MLYPLGTMVCDCVIGSSLETLYLGGQRHIEV